MEPLSRGDAEVAGTAAELGGGGGGGAGEAPPYSPELKTVITYEFGSRFLSQLNTHDLASQNAITN